MLKLHRQGCRENILEAAKHILKGGVLSLRWPPTPAGPCSNLCTVHCTAATAMGKG